MPRSKPDMLTETKVRNAKPSPGTKAKPDPRPKKYFDGDGRGLYLLVNPNGSKLWRYKFRMHGKERLVSLGRYPDIGLADARRARDERRKLVANGVDPVALKREKHEERREELRATFGEAAERYFKRKAHGWSITHRRDVRRTQREAGIDGLRARREQLHRTRVQRIAMRGDDRQRKRAEAIDVFVGHLERFLARDQDPDPGRRRAGPFHELRHRLRQVFAIVDDEQ